MQYSCSLTYVKIIHKAKITLYIPNFKIYGKLLRVVIELSVQRTVQMIGYVFFLKGMVLASMFNPWYGVLTILGGLLMGFGHSIGAQKSRTLYFVSFLFLFVLITGAYLIGITIILD
jgi:hypothetical protein